MNINPYFFSRHLSNYSINELGRWCTLRAMEWCSFPAFITQPIIPILLIFFNIKNIFISLVITEIIWVLFVRYRYINLDLMDIGPIFVKLKFVTVPASCICFLINHNIPLALIALISPLYALIGSLHKSSFGRVESMIYESMGFDMPLIDDIE